MKDGLGNPHRQAFSFTVYTPQPPLLATCSTCRQRCQVVVSQQFYKIYYQKVDERKFEILSAKS
jgi:hypothetical protein